MDPRKFYGLSVREWRPLITFGRFRSLTGCAADQVVPCTGNRWMINISHSSLERQCFSRRWSYGCARGICWPHVSASQANDRLVFESLGDHSRGPRRHDPRSRQAPPHAAPSLVIASLTFISRSLHPLGELHALRMLHCSRDLRYSSCVWSRSLQIPDLRSQRREKWPAKKP
jgi:hypothetical protein